MIRHQWRVVLFVALALGWGAEAGAEEASWRRVPTPVARTPLEQNIRPQYEIEKAAWVWADGARPDEKLVLEFENQFTLDEAAEVVLHVTADQRYELSLDGRLMSIGPDRSDLAHWAFATYRVRLPAGPHRLSATVAWIGDDAPCAQTTHRGGFLLAAEGPLGRLLNTGSGRWRARRVEGWSFAPGPGPDFVGRSQTIDARPSGGEAALSVVAPPLAGNWVGLMRPGWRLYPSPLPDQKLETLGVGTVRAVLPGQAGDGPVGIDAPHAGAPERADWQRLADGAGGVTTPAGATVSVLFDLGDYRTAYPRVTIAGGRGAKVRVAWAESLYERDAGGGPTRSKGDRDEVVGKAFHGIADAYVPAGGERSFRPWWWRSGRYVLLSVSAAEEPVEIKRFDLLQTRYPLEDEGRFESSDAALDRTHELMVRGMQACAHETYMDCPYYEQLMYVGDTRVELLTTYAMTPDARLPKRAIELFDWSTSTWGMAAEHYPSRTPQLSPTFAMIWVGMVRDFAYWRDDPAWVRGRLATMRATIDRFLLRIEDDGLLGPLPGWPFVDWVDGWGLGIPPAGKEGKSSVVNLQLVRALQQAAEVEDAYGEAALARRCRDWADRIGRTIVERFWSRERGLLADDLDRRAFSEHAQCLALLGGVLPTDQQDACVAALLKESDLKRCSIYFSFYLFETLARHGRGDEIVRRWDLWKGLNARGLKTPIESPEPTRSDCHAWGSHPLFHARASLFGVRPASPGFASVVIEPRPGGLEWMSVRVPHPRGQIEGTLRFDHAAQACEGAISLPPGVGGVFKWRGRSITLAPGGETPIAAR